MPLEPATYAETRQAWRDWLKKHHASADEIWLVYYKKHAGKPSVTYRESLEEALCFGWVDGIRKRLDKDRYAQRFTPRREKSRWSPLNIRLARELIEAGRMTEAGLAAFENRVEYEPEILAAAKSKDPELSPEFEKAIRANRQAWENFQALAPSYRKQFVGWLMAARKPETQQKRLKETIEVLEQGGKLGMR